jgi:hypothetical protein
MNRTDKYTRQINADFHWDKVKAEAHREGYCLLGTTFGLTPSGKFYTPFAASNVAGCRQCKGTGTVRRSAGNADRLAAAQARLAAVDIRAIVAEHGGYASWPSEIRDEVAALRDEVAAARVTQTCTWCGGSGSHEAARDADWFTALERVAEAHGLFVGGPDGADGCDVFVGDASVLDDDGNYDGGGDDDDDAQ